jgi:hypothetical protein
MKERARTITTMGFVLGLALALVPTSALVSRAESKGARLRGLQVSPVLQVPSGVTVELRGAVARMSNGDTFTCGCSDVACEGSCQATQKGDTLSCSGSCMTSEEFHGCIRQASCGWHQGGPTAATRSRGPAPTQAGPSVAPPRPPPSAPRMRDVEAR